MPLKTTKVRREGCVQGERVHVSVAVSQILDDDCPQEIRNRWKLESDKVTKKQLIAYLTQR